MEGLFYPTIVQSAGLVLQQNNFTPCKTNTVEPHYNEHGF